MPLTKTHYLSGLHCPKRLHLHTHHPELAEKTTAPAAVTGQVVEQHARLEFPDGVLVQRHLPDQDPFAETTRLMQDPQINTIFEAGFTGDDLTVFVDVLQRNGNGWDVIEIKATTRLDDMHIDDVAVQALALSCAGVSVKHFFLMHINNAFVYQGQGDYAGLFVREQITDDIRHHVPFIEQQLAPFDTLLAGPLPQRHMGSYCKNPYRCPYYTYCESQEVPYPVGTLPNGWRVAQTLLAQGIVDIRDIPDDALTSERHQWVRQVTLSGQAQLRPGAKHLLDQLDYPRYYLDFECMQFAIPIWANTRPYVQLPFQWSCHIQHAPDLLTHEAFLDTSGRDPRYRFAQTLLAACGEAGPIIVYHESFEKRIIRELADTFADLRAPLLALNERVFDLLPVVRQHYYHPDMKGSWSIKSVLPRLVPELSYTDLGTVQDGLQAQTTYLQLINNTLTPTQKQTLHQDLLNYCQLDTYAMVSIANKLGSGLPFPTGDGLLS